jgi:hypothetical protein
MDIREYRYGNAIIKVYRPDRTEKQRNEQEQKILTALQIVGKAMKENQNGNNN